MAIDRDQLRQHLLQAAQAYGDDMQLPLGQALAVNRPSAEVSAPPPPTPPQPPRPLPTSSRPTPSTPVRHEAPVAQSEPPPPAAIERDPTPASRAPGTPASEREVALARVRAEVTPCTRCKLCKTRTNTVFGEGTPTAEVMFLGEAPGAQEDLAGRPFVGPSGQLLDRILENAMGLRRDQVFIANVNKCRPPGNRDPEPDEVAACLPFLREQIAIVQPKVLVCLGRIAARNLLETALSVTALRLQNHTFEGIPVVVTWHPAFLLRDPSHKRETWDDIKRVNRLLGRPEVPPPAGA
ncbi:MAG: uracil-DNA glycosylase [Planctomycetes bacterium]|jgi:uracil-DNA glycosylase family 4|nr:uracil-DNA glycosylase [Planctomycetota bacterium]MCC7065815.1 uracil-DNA glycosylase [Planctomycetota bacterium]